MAARHSLATLFDAGWSESASPRYLFFGGKGGTGKTTCAAAAAIALAEHGRHVLVVSTDPAHSLGDILRRKLTSRPSRITVRRGLLNACELDADRALRPWLAARRPALATIFERGTILDRVDVEPFLERSLPGVDELLGLLEIERLASAKAYDHVVIDTAPTGHTLRLLATPAIFKTLARVLDQMQEKHRVLAAAFGRDAARDVADALIEEFDRAGERLGALLRHPSRMRLCWVMLAEEMSVAESIRAMAVLRGERIPVNEIVVNRLTPPPPSTCALCDGRRRFEAQWLSAISTRWGHQGIGIWTLPALEKTPQGIGALRAVGRSVSPLTRSIAQKRGRRRASHVEADARPHQTLPVPLRQRATRLLIVGGKGGVGKTTCAATLALAVARDAPDRRVLLVSTDPAHSVGDVIGQTVGELERPLRGGPENLVAREIDAAREWHARREEYRDAVARFLETGSRASGAALSIDGAIIEQLFELAPPGMDEIVGILTMIDALVAGKRAAPASATAMEGRFDLVIVDSAPTGHTLRLLALPAQAQAWVRQLTAVLLKYEAVAAFERLATELVWLSRGLRRLRSLLANPRQCGFVVVTRPEQLPADETTRLIEWLSQHRIARRALIVNGVTPPGCSRCRRTAARERRRIASFTGASDWKRGGGPIIVTDAIAPPPKGVAALDAWQRTWRSFRGNATAAGAR